MERRDLAREMIPRTFASSVCAFHIPQLCLDLGLFLLLDIECELIMYSDRLYVRLIPLDKG